jgi:hypothetical protein
MDWIHHAAVSIQSFEKDLSKNCISAKIGETMMQGQKIEADEEFLIKCYPTLTEIKLLRKQTWIGNLHLLH